MDESIFNTIKSLLGPDADYDVFDTDIMIFINAAFSTLTQLGLGPSEGFFITGESEKWSDFLSDAKDLESVKAYIFMKTKLAFDPPSSSFALSAYQDACKEYEWRLNVAVDPRIS